MLGVLLRQFGPLETVTRPEYPATPAQRILPTRPSMPDLSKEVASRVTAQFKPALTCIHNSNVVYDLAQLKDLRVDCWPQAMELNKTTRAGPSRFPVISLAIQQRAADQEKMDLLTNLADDVLTWFADSGRWASGKLYCTGGAFSGTDVFDRLTKYEANVFQTIMLINFRNFK